MVDDRGTTAKQAPKENTTTAILFGVVRYRDSRYPGAITAADITDPERNTVDDFDLGGTPSGRYPAKRKAGGGNAPIPRAADTAPRERIPRELRREVLAGDPRCVFCQVAKSTTVDHLLPVFRGGRNEAGNLAGCCRACNAAKAHQTLAETMLVLHPSPRLRAFGWVEGATTRAA